MKAPEAKKITKILEKHGDQRVDPYYWLNDREDPEVIAYLKEENAFLENSLSHTKDLQEKLFQEMKGRMKEREESVPYEMDGYLFYFRYEEGKEYALNCRKKLGSDLEEILIDENKLAQGHEYFNLGAFTLSTNQKILAFATDTIGRRIYSIRIKHLESGKEYSETIEGVTGNMVWANDNETLFYARQDENTLRAHQIYKHKLGTDPKYDVLVYEEKDDTFSTWISKTKSRKYLLIGSYQTLSTEFRILEADNPHGEFRVFQKRERDHEYYFDHFKDQFYIITNWEAKNSRLMQTHEEETSKENWKELIPHRQEVQLKEIEIFDDYLVISERKEGLNHLSIREWDSDNNHYLKFKEDVYLAYISINMEFGTKWLRIGYQSMTTPVSTFDYNMETREMVLKKEKEVLGGFKKENYKSERVYAKSRDGKEIPISIVYRKDNFNAGKNPCIIYGYGSYGSTIDPYFSAARLSLLDRGFVWAIAHIRGSQINGRPWYEDGKLLKKKNTFFDFIDSSDHLIRTGYAEKKSLYAIGGSAGGLLMGAVVNYRPELYRGVLAAVPFVDVVTTMLDDSIPLTTGEYDEWGNPNEKEFYEYIKSYSPYDNVEAKDYPHLLVTTGFHDSQVQYWEPAKWVAKLRELKTDNNQLFLFTNMDAGHGGASGRYKQFKETALEYAFMLNLEGISK